MTTISPGVTETELLDSDHRSGRSANYPRAVWDKIAMSPDAVAAAISYAIGQGDVDVNKLSYGRQGNDGDGWRRRMTRLAGAQYPVRRRDELAVPPRVSVLSEAGAFGAESQPEVLVTRTVCFSEPA